MNDIRGNACGVDGLNGKAAQACQKGPSSGRTGGQSKLTCFLELAVPNPTPKLLTDIAKFSWVAGLACVNVLT